MHPLVANTRWPYDLLAWLGAVLLHALLLGLHFRSPDLTLRLLHTSERPVSMVVSLTSTLASSPMYPDAPSVPSLVSPVATQSVAPPVVPVESPSSPPSLAMPKKPATVSPDTPSVPTPPPPSPVTAPGGSSAKASPQAQASAIGAASSEGGDAIPAQVTQKGIPIYPKAALNDGASGHIEVEVSLSPFGSVTDVKVIHSTGHRALDMAFLAAIRTHYQFAPKRVLGVPVASTMRLEHRFELD